jgi:DNA-binding transcriptional ArsR family regulator
MNLSGADSSKNSSSFLNLGSTPLPKSTLSQHLRILREAGLIRSERKGVELQNQSRCPELKKKFGTMLASIIKAYQSEGHKV